MNKDEDQKKPARKRYTKPEIRKIKLRPEEAVLGACKTGGGSGPIQPMCNMPAPCSNIGS